MRKERHIVFFVNLHHLLHHIGNATAPKKSHVIVLVLPTETQLK